MCADHAELERGFMARSLAFVGFATLFMGGELVLVLRTLT
jgi:hypothetical protein